jgi:transposase-like protein
MQKITISEYKFFAKFPNERTARQHIEKRRWQGHPVCPHCGGVNRIRPRRIESYYRCLSCKNDFTVRTGTIFERSHVTLDKWLYAIHLLSTSRKGVSSVQLSKKIGVTQKTAWVMLQRLQEAYKFNGLYSDDGPLPGIVEIAETYMTNKETNHHESKRLKAGQPVGKVDILDIRERSGHLKTVVLDRCIQAEVRNALSPGSTL